MSESSVNYRIKIQKELSSNSWLIDSSRVLESLFENAQFALLHGLVEKITIERIDLEGSEADMGSKSKKHESDSFDLF